MRASAAIVRSDTFRASTGIFHERRARRTINISLCRLDVKKKKERKGGKKMLCRVYTYENVGRVWSATNTEGSNILCRIKHRVQYIERHPPSRSDGFTP